MYALFLLGTLLILLAMVIQLIPSCPSSCLVCTENVTLCQGLTYIPGNQVRHFKRTDIYYIQWAHCNTLIVLTVSGLCIWKQISAIAV